MQATIDFPLTPMPAGEVLVGACPRCHSLRFVNPETLAVLNTVTLPRGTDVTKLHFTAAEGSKIKIPVSVCDDCNGDPGERLAA